MLLKTLQTIFLVIAFLGMSNASHAKKSPKITEFIFHMTDKNQDGRVTWAEARQSDSHLTKAGFDTIDTNGDGFITLKEYKRHIKNYNK